MSLLGGDANNDEESYDDLEEDEYFNELHLDKSITEMSLHDDDDDDKDDEKLNKSETTLKSKEAKPQSINTTHQYHSASALNLMSSFSFSKKATTNLLMQLDNFKCKLSPPNNSDELLNSVINIYNTELDYLSKLKYAFEIYAEPLR